ncbi:MAG: carboxypeptidase regulatory-like domain-containing protein [Bryobacteraceae bacterium]
MTRLKALSEIMFVALCFTVLPCFAQDGKAELFGTIRDPSTLPIANADIQFKEQTTNALFLTRSGEQGEYHLVGLPVGVYVLTVQHEGFRMYRQSNITMRIADQVSLDVQLSIGQTTQTVEVNEQASLLQTASGAVSFSVDEKKIVTLPLDGRNFVPLVALSPGVALPGGRSLLPRINGSRPRTNEYIYDGISALQPEPGQVVFYPIIDAIEEFRININSYSPECGRSNGGTVIVNTKSGSNNFHGTLFEFFRNEHLNGKNYFAAAGSKPEFRRNQYGLTFGGPIQKNRAFFFIDGQGTRLRTGIPRISTVPSLAQRSGIFSSPIYDPSAPARSEFPGNRIPRSRFDPIAVQTMARYPLPNRPGTANNYIRTGVEPDSQDQFDTRLDRYFGNAQRVFGRFSYVRDDDTPVTPLPDGSGAITSGVISQTATRGYQGVAEHEWTLSPTLLNQARFGYTTRESNGVGPLNEDLNVPGIPANSFSSALPTFNVSGYQQIGPSAGANSRFTTSVTEYMDTMSVVSGKHSIKVGADIRREALDVLQPPNPAGAYTFSTTGTNKSGIENSGNAVASLLLGEVSAFTIDIQRRELRERANIAEFFAGDDWKLSKRLMVNFGTRYTLNFPSHEVDGQGAVFNLRLQMLDFPQTARDLECCDFGPRAGLAYRADDNTVIRSGYRMIWFEQTGITTPFTLPQFPFVQTVGQQSQDNINAAFLLANGPTVQVSAPNPNSGLGQGVFGTQRDNGSGYSQQWNFTVERTFGQNVNFEVGYLGSKNTRLGLPEANLNQLPSADLVLGTALLTKVPNPYYGQLPASSSLDKPLIAEQQLLRAYPRFTNVALFRNNVGNSTYHAVEAKLEKRFSSGLTFTFAYTFSKLIDDASSYFSQTIFTGPVLNSTGAADALNRHLEKDVSSGDIPRVFSGGWVYDIPRWWKISGWQIAGLARVQAGDAVAVTQATNNNASLGFAVQRPNRSGDPNGLSNRSANHWFNVAAFTNAPQFTIGTSSRNPVRGPGLQTADLMLGKTFRITERFNAEFRAEVFNLTNTPPFNDPNGSFGSPGFGTITTAGNPRDFEFAVKAHF